MNMPHLMDTARALVADDKGLLAMDESNPTCNQRFASLGIPHRAKCNRAARRGEYNAAEDGHYASDPQ